MFGKDGKECKMCDTVTGVFGILLGSVILFISIDLLTGGKIASLISGGINEEETEDDN